MLIDSDDNEDIIGGGNESRSGSFSDNSSSKISSDCGWFESWIYKSGASPYLQKKL